MYIILLINLYIHNTHRTHKRFANNLIGSDQSYANRYASRPLLRCRPRAQYEVHELPLFAEKSRSCRVVQERGLVQHEEVASMKITLHELTRALYVIARGVYVMTSLMRGH